MKQFFLALVISALPVIGFSQGSDFDRAAFVEGSRLMEEYNYPEALPIWLDLLQNQPENSNLNYKAGFCYLQISRERKKALPYLKKAVTNTTVNYDPYAPSEEAAPLNSYYYIGEAYHLNYEFDKAIEYYKEFKTLITDRHEYYKKVDLQIASCERAKRAVANPVDVKVMNLGSNVNSKYKDHSPIVSVDESALYFTSRRLRKDSSNLYSISSEDGQYYEDIYVSYKGDDGKWGEAEILESINTIDNEATLNLSSDGETMFIYKSEGLNGNIYQSKFDGSKWSAPVKLGSDINTDAEEKHATISPDGRRLYFVSNRKGSIKFEEKCCDHISSFDIYFCNLLPTGEWAKAQPIGSGLNTPVNEDGIFIHPDGKTMYFSSQGHETLGDYDIFYTEMDEEGNWGKPINMGYPINTTGKDLFFVTSADGKRGYYSSVQTEGYGESDIYMINMLSLKEKPLTLLIGKIVASDGSKVPDDIQIYVTDNDTKEEVGIYKPRARDNKFTIIIPPGSDYHLSYENADTVFYEDDIFVSEESAYQEINKAVDLKPINFSGGEIMEEPTKAPAKKETPKEPVKKAPEAPKETKKVAPVVAPTPTPKKKEAPKAVAEKSPAKPKEQPAYKTEVESVDGQKYIIHKVEKGNSLFTISLLYNTSLTAIQAANPWAGDLIYEDDKVKVPISPSAKFYQEFFSYNETDVKTDDKDFENFIDQVLEVSKSEGKATIAIESSASKVPTAKFGTNENLTEKRAEVTKEKVIAAVKAKGGDASKLYFASMSTLVRGPAYQNDATANKTEYEKYQYVKIMVK